ncbi:hypothetical protein [Mucilaginibacter sp. HD30]
MAIIANIYLDEHSSSGGFTRWSDVYINLIDSVTHLPVNGDNVVVTYQLTELIDGTEHYSTHTATIAGQSQLIDSGVPTFVTGYDEFDNLIPTYYRSYLIIGVGDAPDPSPPVNACDLQIVNVLVDKFESSPGANDAQITINATSSYLPILYSIDNTTFQSSNVFAGVAGGLKTVYVTDANNFGCAVNQSVTVRTLNSLLVSDPSVTVAGNVSRWNAAFNPIVFTYQRQDFEVYSVGMDGATSKAKLLINAPIDKLRNGDKVYVNAGNYNGVFEVVSSPADNTLVIDAPFTANATGFININKLRPYYAINTKITYQDPVTGQQKTIESTNRPNNAGMVKADISNFLQSLISTKDDSNFTNINYRDTNLSASYRISFAQQWDDENGKEITSEYTEIADTFFVAYAAKQLGQRYGGNLAEYVPFKTITSGAQPASWITDFVEPAYSNAYPFDIGFIYSEDLLGLQLYCELNLLDINRNPVGGATETIELLNEDGSWLLNQDGSRYVIANQTASINPLAEQLGLNRLLINSSFAPEAYYFTLTIKYNDDNDVRHTVTQTQTIRIDDAIDDNSVYLRWIGLSGSWNYYRFVYNQEVSLDVQNATIVKNYVSDWEHQESIEEVISKSAGQKIKVMAEDLTVNDIKGLQSIKYSPKVQMLVNKNPVKWQTVVLNTATFSEYETRNGQAPFSVTFNLPSINIQTQ